MSFDEFEKTAFDNYDNIKFIKLVQIVLFVEPYKKFQKDIINKYGNNQYVILYYPIHVNKSVYGTVQNYNKALMQAVKLSSSRYDYKSVKKLLNNFNSIQDELKKDEIKESLKYMKRYIYPKINQGDEWKQLATQIELQLKALE